MLGTHGTCCDGPNSTYNIVVGRSRKVTGPYIDNMGRDMLEGGGKMVLVAGNRQTGPGHFGRFIETDGVEKMSCHFEADFDRGGRSVLAIRPLLWKNEWPVAGEVFKEVHTKLNPNVEDTLLNLVLISYVWKEADTVFGKKVTNLFCL